MRIFNYSTTTGFFVDRAVNFRLDVGEGDQCYAVLLDIDSIDSLTVCACYVYSPDCLPLAIKEAERIRRIIFDAIVDGSPDIMVSDRFYAHDGRWGDVDYIVSHDVPEGGIVFPGCYQDKAINCDEN